MSEAPTRPFESVLPEVFKSMAARIFTALPGQVVEYFDSNKTIDAQPVVLRAYPDENGDRQTEEYPIITRCPVVFPGSGGVRLKFPISRGDWVLLVFSHSSIEQWLEASRSGLDDPDDRHHSLNDAIAIPGLQSWSAKDNSPMIDFTSDGTIEAGGSDALVTVTEFMAHTHNISGVAAGAATLPTLVPTVTITGTAILKGG